MDLHPELSEAQKLAANLSKQTLRSSVEIVNKEFKQNNFARTNPQLLSAVVNAQSEILNTLITKVLEQRLSGK